MDKNRKNKEEDRTLDELIEKLKKLIGSPGRKFDEFHMILPFINIRIDKELEEIMKEMEKMKKEKKRK